VLPKATPNPAIKEPFRAISPTNAQQFALVFLLVCAVAHNRQFVLSIESIVYPELRPTSSAPTAISEGMHAAVPLNSRKK
jgi:hypothetical protein